MRLNDQQALAATCPLDSDTLVLAGAGTGKTRTLIARAQHLIEAGVAPGGIVMLTFSRRAAREMLERLSEATGSGQVWAGTFHAFCLEAIRHNPRVFGTDESVIIDREDQTSLMRKARGDVTPKHAVKDFPKAKKLLETHSYARNCDIALDKYLRYYSSIDDTHHGGVTAAIAQYEDLKRTRGYLDFDDILHRFATVVSDNTEVRDALAARLTHLLVDEMQDTNPIQWKILNALRTPARLFCVGDDAQSIYAFRGADIRNIQQFAVRVPGAQVLPLTCNYRSTQEILDVSNWLMRCSPIDYDKELVAHRGAGARPVMHDFRDGFAEARWVAEDIEQRHIAGVPWADQAVLVRTARSAKQLEAELIERQIPYKFTGGASLMQSAHVKDLVATLRAALDVRDELAWLRYLKLWPKVGDRTAAKVVDALLVADEDAVPADVLAAALPKRSDIVEVLRKVSTVSHAPGEALGRAHAALEPLLSAKYDHWDSRKRDFELLRTLAEKQVSLAAFLDTYTLDPVYTDHNSASDDNVQIYTIHAAKGAEFPVCYLIQAQPGMYPHVFSQEEEDGIEEERRVFYVALTRAKNALILTRSQGQDANYGYYRPDPAVYFLSEVPDLLLEHEGEDRVTYSPSIFGGLSALG